MISGANAVRGDTVRNLTTGEIGKMTDSSQWGRIIVDGVKRWERWDIEVIREPPTVSAVCKSILLASAPCMF